jgi:hypothetical protein
VNHKTNPVLYEYKNGNCKVFIHEDGTKVREVYAVSAPVMPESIDLKITDQCDNNCSYCHEGSTPEGKHAAPETIFSIVEGLHAGAEIALGGGDPLYHPNLREILEGLKERRLIANITIRPASFFKKESNPFNVVKAFRELVDQKLVFGVGLTADDYAEVFNEVFGMNAVFHCILGVTSPRVGMSLNRIGKKILILGFKTVGRGQAYWDSDPSIKTNIREWKFWLQALLSSPNNSIVSFDTLAIEQLGVEEMVKPEVWKEHFMGREGEYTMYVDAVNKEYAVSSSSPRTPIGDKDIREMFYDVRKKAGF